VWLLVGLGARGFVYHAWLGKVLAAAVINDNEALLPPELLAWKTDGQEQQSGCQHHDVMRQSKTQSR
jgi:cell division protein FtsB